MVSPSLGVSSPSCPRSMSNRSKPTDGKSRSSVSQESSLPYHVNEIPLDRLNAAVGSQYEAGVERYHSW